MAAFENIATSTSASTTSLTISSIPQTFTDLWGYVSFNSTNSNPPRIQFNGTASSYQSIDSYATQGVNRSNGTNQSDRWTQDFGAGGGYFGGWFCLYSYARTSEYKNMMLRYTLLSTDGTRYNAQAMISWINTQAVTSLVLDQNGGTMTNVNFMLFGAGA